METPLRKSYSRKFGGRPRFLGLLSLALSAVSRLPFLLPSRIGYISVRLWYVLLKNNNRTSSRAENFYAQCKGEIVILIAIIDDIFTAHHIELAFVTLL